MTPPPVPDAMAFHARRAVPALSVIGLLAAAPLAAQAPGYQQIDNRRILAEYQAEVLEQVNRLMARWGRAWSDDDVDALADLYWEEAVLIPAGEPPVRGREAIRAHLREALPADRGVEAFMLDFDASGGMAVVYGNYLFDGAGARRSGPLVTVYLQRGRTWKIRSQVFTER